MLELAKRVAERSPPLKSTSAASALAMFNTLSVRALTSSREYIRSAPEAPAQEGARGLGKTNARPLSSEAARPAACVSQARSRNRLRRADDCAERTRSTVAAASAELVSSSGSYVSLRYSRRGCGERAARGAPTPTMPGLGRSWRDVTSAGAGCLREGGSWNGVESGWTDSTAVSATGSAVRPGRRAMNAGSDSSPTDRRRPSTSHRCGSRGGRCRRPAVLVG